MLREDLEREKDVLRQVASAREAVRRKYRAIKSGKEIAAREFTTLFQPVIEPLEKLTEQQQQKQQSQSKQNPVEVDQNILKRLRSSFPKKELDTSVFGVRETPGRSHMIGDAVIRFSPDHILVDEKVYPRTQGLTELILKKSPNENQITSEDKEHYRDILKSSNAYRTGYSDSGAIRGNRSLKYTRFIGRLISGHGLPESMLLNPTSKKEYIFYDDVNELVQRLQLLAAAYNAGNQSVNNEIVSILEELRELDLIE